MSCLVDWIAASVEDPTPFSTGDTENHGETHEAFTTEVTEKHRATALALDLMRIRAEESWEQELERRIYRRRTVAMLRRYMRYSLETGRLPSLVGREFFRSKVTKYTMVTFEDRVIFVYDMEKCLKRLDHFGREVLARVVLQEYDQEEAAQLLGCTRMTVHRKLLEAIDNLTTILLELDLLSPIDAAVENSCQEGEEGEFIVSDCEQDE